MREIMHTVCKVAMLLVALGPARVVADELNLKLVPTSSNTVIVLNGRIVSRSELSTTVRRLASFSSTVTLPLRADPRVPLGEVTDTLSLIRAAGLTNGIVIIQSASGTQSAQEWGLKTIWLNEHVRAESR